MAAIRVSDQFAAAVREEAAASDRSIAGQIEHWAKLGRASEALFSAPLAAALKACGGNLDAIDDANFRAKVEQRLASVSELSPAEMRRKLGLEGKTIFGPDPSNSGRILKHSRDGSVEPVPVDA
jgi:hypothetical protein